VFASGNVRKCPRMSGFFDIFSDILAGGGFGKLARRKILDGFGHGNACLLWLVLKFPGIPDFWGDFSGICRGVFGRVAELFFQPDQKTHPLYKWVQKVKVLDVFC
jgi:hypothetical protein